MRNQIDKQEIGNFIVALAHYEGLVNYVTQLDPKQSVKLNEFYTKANIANIKMSEWNYINVHIVRQTWCNTSCGWQGVGGSAMSDSYTIVIENRLLKAIFVYYGSELAYIAEMDEKLDRDYIRLPGIVSAKTRLNLIYYKK